MSHQKSTIFLKVLYGNSRVLVNLNFIYLNKSSFFYLFLSVCMCAWPCVYAHIHMESSDWCGVSFSIFLHLVLGIRPLTEPLFLLSWLANTPHLHFSITRLKIKLLSSCLHWKYFSSWATSPKFSLLNYCITIISENYHLAWELIWYVWKFNDFWGYFQFLAVN